MFFIAINDFGVYYKYYPRVAKMVIPPLDLSFFNIFIVLLLRLNWRSDRSKAMASFIRFG
jgi:hypothetical protein